MPSEWDVVESKPAAQASPWGVVEEKPAAPKKTWMQRLSSYIPDSYGETQEKIAAAERAGAETIGKQMVEYSPITGVPEMVQGARNLASPPAGTNRRQAGRQIISGFGKTLAPLAVPAALAAPIPLAMGMAGGMAAQYGVTKGLEAAGVEPDTAGLLGDVAGFIPPGAAAKRIVGAFRKPAPGSPGPMAAPELGIPAPKPVEVPLMPTAESSVPRLVEIPVPKAEPPAAQRLITERKGTLTLPTKQQISEKTQGARTQLTDEYAPIKDLVAGKNLSADADPYVGARLYAGHAGKIDNRLNELRGILKPAKAEGLMDAMTKYAVYERHEELAARLPDYKLPGGQTLADIQSEKMALETQLGPKLPQVKTYIDGIRQYSDRLLTEARDAGVISAESYKQIKKDNQKYVPLQRLEYVAEQMGKDKDGIPHNSNAFSVAQQDVFKRIQGSEKEILDPLQSMIRNTYKVVGLVERNKVARQMAALSNHPEFAGVIQPLRSGAAPATGQGKFSILLDGVKQDYVGPEAVVDSLKGLNRKQADLITKMASFSSRALRAGATSLNVPFLASNVIRDFQTATLVSKVGFTPLDWGKGFAAAIRRGPEFRDFMESGGSFSGFFERNQSLPTSVKTLSQSTGAKVLKTVVKPWELLRLAAETTELAPRIGVHMRSKAKGMTQAEAGFNARNATVDFAKAGTATRVANMWVPFLNARLQGTINTLSTVKDRPGHAALTLSTIVGLPVAATYVWNKQFQDVMDDIAPFEKESNFVIAFGREKDDSGNYKQVVKIPKGDVGRIFGNPLENFLAYLGNKDPKSIGDLAMQVGSDVSPIPFEKEGKLSATAFAGGALPPTFKAVVEGGLNKNFYTERDIVPKQLQDASPTEQYKADTPAPFVALGEFTGTSPMKWQNAAGTQFGGLGRQLSEPGKALGVMSKRFVGARGGEQEQKQWDVLAESKREVADVRVKTDRAAKQLHSELLKLEPGQRQVVLSQRIADKSVTPEVLESLGTLLEKDTSSDATFERSLKSSPIEARARFMVKRLKQASPEEQERLLSNWSEKNLITDQVSEAIVSQLSAQ